MLEINNITKKYRKGADIFTALENVSLKIDKGEFCTVIGHSGSGKSTLLHTIGGMIHPDSGSVCYDNKDIYLLPGKQLDSYRKKKVGFVFQQFHLMPYLTVNENIKLACRERKHYENIAVFLEKCSLSDQRDKYPAELSVGEKQRTAFIRAIISEPELLLADEPTGNLDPENSGILLTLISDFQKNGGTVILVSHDPGISKYATKSIVLEKGRIA
jgi:ABC-type lipoprotein export system ATPase subunit